MNNTNFVYKVSYSERAPPRDDRMRARVARLLISYLFFDEVASLFAPERLYSNNYNPPSRVWHDDDRFLFLFYYSLFNKYISSHHRQPQHHHHHSIIIKPYPTDAFGGRERIHHIRSASRTGFARNWAWEEQS